MSLFVNRDLARRLERVEGFVGTSFVDARVRLNPHVKAAWREIGGAFAMFDGPDSPITQAFGLGMGAPVVVADVEAIESFFAERGAPTNHEVCPLAGVETSALLAERGYRPVEQSNVLVQSTSDGALSAGASLVRVRVAEPATRPRGSRRP